jgi:DnaJ-class molecular chaperone
MARVIKERIRCDMCNGRGKLWLSGADYLECPQCFGEHTIPVETHQLQARVRTFFVAGQKPWIEMKLPRSIIADVEIPYVR